MHKFFDSFGQSFTIFWKVLPSIIGALICFVLTLLLARFFSGLAGRYTRHRTRDNLIANFLGKIVWTAFFIIGTVIALGILGLGGVSNKILAGAGITTFVIGFALKDIGENFLAGLMLAFSRPYREGSLIECRGIKGIVRGMTMRQTTVETEGGQLILIPNSSIIKEPLTRFVHSDLDMRQEFALSVAPQEARKAINLISEAVSSLPYVRRAPGKPVRVMLENLQGSQAKLKVVFWFDTAQLNEARSEERSELIMKVLDKLSDAGISYSGA